MKLRRLIALLLLLIAAAPATAAVTITFYSHEFGSRFPHAFIYLEGTPDAGGAPVAGNYGFTATSVTPAILMGSVKGDVESASPSYVAKSQPHWQMRLTDTQYGEVLALLEKWRTLPGRSYNLNRRNCVHFVAEMARTLGLRADEKAELMKKPRSFLEDVLRQNAALRVADAGGAVPTLAATSVAGVAPALPPGPLPKAAPLAEGAMRTGAAQSSPAATGH